MKLRLSLQCLIGLGIRLEELHENNTNRYTLAYLGLIFQLRWIFSYAVLDILFL